MSGYEVIVHNSADEVAEALAARLIARLTELQRDFRVPQVCLTGGRIATRAYGTSPRRGPLRRGLVPGGAVVGRRAVRAGRRRRPERRPDARHPRRPLPLDPERIHMMPPSDAAAWIWMRRPTPMRAELGATRVRHLPARHGSGRPRGLDLPRAPLRRTPMGDVIGVRASPKPPPERISLTLPVINRSREVWFVVSGSDKAAAAKMALLGAGPVQVPAAGVSGVERTLWLLDRDAAAQLPPDLAARPGLT